MAFGCSQLCRPSKGPVSPSNFRLIGRKERRVQATAQSAESQAASLATLVRRTKIKKNSLNLESRLSLRMERWTACIETFPCCTEHSSSDLFWPLISPAERSDSNQMTKNPARKPMLFCDDSNCFEADLQSTALVPKFSTCF